MSLKLRLRPYWVVELHLEFIDTAETEVRDDVFIDQTYINETPVEYLRIPTLVEVDPQLIIESGKQTTVLPDEVARGYFSANLPPHARRDELRRAIRLLQTRDEHNNDERMKVEELIQWLSDMGWEVEIA